MSHDEIAGLQQWLVRIEAKLDNMTRNGCAKADTHADVEGRLRKVEATIAEGRGAYKFAHVLSAVIGAALTFFAGKIWK